MSKYFDRQGNAMELLEWARRFETGGPDKRVAYDAIPTADGEIKISTVWLGLDHSFGSGPPLIFETMVFAPDGHPLDGEQARYSTEAEAVAGHSAILAKVRAAL